MKKTPNPQGKGLVPLLDEVYRSRIQLAVPAKKIDQVTNELFTSMFVLESQFQFKPVVGKTYWLYKKAKSFRLSPISPDEWHGNHFGDYIAECQLQSDITWTLKLDEQAALCEGLNELIQRRRDSLVEQLNHAESLSSALPTYLQHLPYYQRVLASALAHSLDKSMQLSGIACLSYTQANILLESSSN